MCTWRNIAKSILIQPLCILYWNLNFSKLSPCHIYNFLRFLAEIHYEMTVDQTTKNIDANRMEIKNIIRGNKFQISKFLQKIYSQLRVSLVSQM